MTTRITRSALLVGTTFVIGCGASSINDTPGDGLLALGTWGGDSAGVIVNDTIVHVHIGCTYGDIAGRIRIDAAGRFSATGSYLLRAYPIAIGPTLPAQFTGQLNGSVLTLTVTVQDTIAKTSVVLGPAETRLGVVPRMANCPICRVPGDRVAITAAMSGQRSGAYRGGGAVNAPSTMPLPAGLLAQPERR